MAEKLRAMLRVQPWGRWVLIGLALISPGEIALTRGPYVQSVTGTSAVIVWRTDLPGSSRVDFGIGGYDHTLDLADATTEHVVTLTDLLPDSEVLYRIWTGHTELATGSFRTAASPDHTFTFAVIGDSGIGSAAQVEVADRVVALDPNFVVHTGDVIYPSGQASGYDPFFFQPYAALLRRAPLYPSLGNHDYGTAQGQPYLDAFVLPRNNPADTERYYSFDWGDAHFVALDFNDGPSAAQLDWLQADLAATTQRWKFVFYHQAVFSSGPHGHEAYLIGKRAVLPPIFEAYDVDVVFNGHDHDYERTVPISDVVYLVSGGGGASLYAVDPQPFSAYAESTYHAVYVTVSACVVQLQAIKPDGTVFDALTLSHDCPAPTATPIASLVPTPTLDFTPTAWLYLPIMLKW